MNYISTFIQNTRLIVVAMAALICAPSVITAQCVAPTLRFYSPVLISGTDREVGAVYIFANAGDGIDAHVEITGMTGGATLTNIDDTTGMGYYDAFQPYVGAGEAGTSYIDWRITFKKAGTFTDTILPCLAVTGVDVDGDASALQEFIEAATPGSFAVDPATNLTVSFDGVRSKAVSPIANIPMIDTSRREGMFQMNFVNISTLDYRNGAITTAGAQVRQTCIYFKPFFANYQLLPLTLLQFNARNNAKSVDIKWTATDEGGLKHYILQRSADGKNWHNMRSVSLQSAASTNHYLVNDFEAIKNITYYRLMQVFNDGSAKYSTVIMVQAENSSLEHFTHNTLFTGRLQLQGSAEVSEPLHVSIYSTQGALLLHRKNILQAGDKSSTIDLTSISQPGMYIMIIENNSGRKVHRSKLMKSL